MRKVRHREVKYFPQGHTAGNWQSNGWYPSSLAPDSVFWTAGPQSLENCKHCINRRSLYLGDIVTPGHIQKWRKRRNER